MNRYSVYVRFSMKATSAREAEIRAAGFLETLAELESKPYADVAACVTEVVEDQAHD